MKSVKKLTPLAGALALVLNALPVYTQETSAESPVVQPNSTLVMAFSQTSVCLLDGTRLRSNQQQGTMIDASLSPELYNQVAKLSSSYMQNLRFERQVEIFTGEPDLEKQLQLKKKYEQDVHALFDPDIAIAFSNIKDLGEPAPELSGCAPQPLPGTLLVKNL